MVRSNSSSRARPSAPKPTFADLSAANEQSREATSLRMNISIALVILVMSLIAFFIGRSVSRPIKAMTRAMGELANGNFGVVLPGLGRKDEIGAMAQAVDQFKVKAEEKAQREAEEKRTEEERRRRGSQGRDDRARRSVRGRGRRHRGAGVVGIRRTRSVFVGAERNRADNAAIDAHRDGHLGTGLRQRAIGRGRDRGDGRRRSTRSPGRFTNRAKSRWKRWRKRARPTAASPS